MKSKYIASNKNDTKVTEQNTEQNTERAQVNQRARERETNAHINIKLI